MKYRRKEVKVEIMTPLADKVTDIENAENKIKKRREKKRKMEKRKRR